MVLRWKGRRPDWARYLTSRDGRVVRSAVGVTFLLSGLVVAGPGRWLLLGVGSILFVLALANRCPLSSWLRAPGDAATDPQPVLRVVADVGDTGAIVELPDAGRQSA